MILFLVIGAVLQYPRRFVILLSSVNILNIFTYH